MQVGKWKLDEKVGRTWEGYTPDASPRITRLPLYASRRINRSQSLCYELLQNAWLPGIYARMVYGREISLFFTLNQMQDVVNLLERLTILTVQAETIAKELKKLRNEQSDEDWETINNGPFDSLLNACIDLEDTIDSLS